MMKNNKHYQLGYFSTEWGKWLYIRFEMGELDKLKQFIKTRRITQYKLDIVEIKLHSVELGV